ncbi:hypothetical protein SLEP1_g4135 [Rubroshorea leprosula]|uniref:Snakin-2 n=1 Tax=Rubroshorea leprosula TaxID=152421 RepID=A0AAV5HVW2_9ROSI|nr:hypothetical protein SLEP1_g4135 [Rubroshorea leprosula]
MPPIPMSNTLLASLFISLLIFHFVESDPVETSSGPQASFQYLSNMVEDGSSDLSSTDIDCGQACDVRCQLSSRPNLCKRACGTCCARCNCVPPGTSGNYDVCPCYRDMTTHGGRHKCP